MGDPGCGKSHTLADEHKRLKSENPDDQVIYCDLKEFGVGDQQSLKNQLLNDHKPELIAHNGRLWILIDGLDKCGLHEPAYWLSREFIGHIQNPEQVFIRITCRVSHWPELLEKAFADHWCSVDKNTVEKWRLCPLREEDVSIAAQQIGVDPEAFLSAISERSVEQLAAFPVTLLFMLRLFQEDRLPKQRTEIFEQGLRLLCEDSPEQRKTQVKSNIPARLRYLTAARIALGYILQGCNGVWQGSSVECPIGLFNSKEIIGKEDGQEIDEQAIRETLELTGIFARLDRQRFQFANCRWLGANGCAKVNGKIME